MVLPYFKDFLHILVFIVCELFWIFFVGTSLGTPYCPPPRHMTLMLGTSLCGVMIDPWFMAIQV